ncbi:MAG: dihydrofolate reductase, partial [Candidatus Izemoplasmatales bacterium]
NDLPWDYKADLKYFREKTSGKTVLMGLETFKSILSRIHKPLPNRHSVIASLVPYEYPGAEVIDDLFAYLKKPREEEIFVIGGKTIYELSFPYADRLYITHIKKEHVGDVYLKKFDLSDFKVISKEETEDLTFAVYERVR